MGAGELVNDPERDPFKVGVLAVSVVTTPALFFWFNTLAGVTLHSFPSPFGRVFLGLLFVSASTALCGVVWQDTARGVLWERTGMYGIASLFVTYGLWALGQFGGTATGFGSLLITLGFAAIVRVRQINKRRKVARRGPT